MKLVVTYYYEIACYLLLRNWLLLTIMQLVVTIRELEALEGGAMHLLTKSKQQQNDPHNQSQ